MLSENYINHIVFVIDSSSSMSHLKNEVIRVTDNQVQYLAQRSKELDQETRATTYMFADDVKCVHYDKDVLRLPSLAKEYRPYGNTALIDATLKAVSDLEKTPELYGDHAFLIYVITDGEENRSRQRSDTLSAKLKSLPDHWTVAVLTPNSTGVYEAKKFGFPPQNISVWDATSSKGFEEAGNLIRKATDTWMTNRSKGIRSSTSIFQLDTSKLDSSTIKLNLQQVSKRDYNLYPVKNAGSEIRTFIEFAEGSYRMGSAFYQITKSETIQANKLVCIVDKFDGTVYTGPQARKLIGLPDDMSARVKPSDHPRYDVFIQSTSVNRKLIPGTQVLVMK